MTGLYGSNGCDRCPEGSYQDLHGQKSCKVCPDGGKSPKGSRTVDDCKRVFFNSTCCLSNNYNERLTPDFKNNFVKAENVIDK